MTHMRSSRLIGLTFLGSTMLALAGCDTLSGIFDSSDTPKLPGKRVSVLAVEQKLKVDKNLATTNVTLPEPVTNRDWSQIGGNASHNLGHLALGNDLHAIWSVDAGEGPQSHLLYTGTPIVADGKVFVLDTQAEVTALDAATGKRLWRVRVSPEDARTDTLGGGIAYGDGKVFVSSIENALRIRTEETGEQAV